MKPLRNINVDATINVLLTLAYVQPLLAICTLVTLALSLIPSRPSLRRLCRRPGSLLCAAIMASLLPILLPPLIDPTRLWINSPRSTAPELVLHQLLLFHTNPGCGWALFGGCLGLVCLGRVRLERSWLELIAFFLIGLWLASFLAWQVCWILLIGP
jgi:hypothetical protein